MTRNDPFLGFNFVVSLVDSSSALTVALRALSGQPAGGFSECSGLDTTLELEDYREGGRNGGVLRFPTRVTWASLRLRRGVTLNDDLWNWHHDFVLGRGKRKDGVVTLLDDLRKPVKAWAFTRGLPAKWTGPSLDAAQGRVAIEELDIGHEGLALLPLGAG